MRERGMAIADTAVAAVLWGTSFPVIKLVLTHQSPVLFLLLRFVFASLFFFIAGRTRGLGGFNKFALLLPSLLLSLSFLLQYIGQTLISASESALLLNSTPVIVPIFAFFIFKERLSAGRYLACALGLVGILLASDATTQALHANLLGALFTFLSALSTTLFIIVTKRIAAEMDAFSYYVPVFVYSTGFMFVYAAPSISGITQTLFSLQPLAASIYLAVACSFLPFLLWYRGLQTLSATESTLISLLEPLVAAALAWVFLHEALSIIQLVGAFLIFLSVFAVSR
ncbi:MAG: DMT family transporter [Methanomassiliicoccales archaeon]